MLFTDATVLSFSFTLLIHTTWQIKQIEVHEKRKTQCDIVTCKLTRMKKGEITNQKLKHIAPGSKESIVKFSKYFYR